MSAQEATMDVHTYMATATEVMATTDMEGTEGMEDIIEWPYHHILTSINAN